MSNDWFVLVNAKQMRILGGELLTTNYLSPATRCSWTAVQTCNHLRIHQPASRAPVAYIGRRIWGGQGQLRQAIKLEADQNSFSVPKMSYLVIFGFFVFGRKWIFIFVLFFVFVQKISFALGRKCYARNWTVTKFCDFRFRISAENGISFSSAISFTAEI